MSRKHMSRSLRISNKQSRHPHQHACSGKMEHRNSETSTRSSSTPSIPQSLAENGLEPFNDTNLLSDFSSPIWVDRVAMNLRPMSFHNELTNPPEFGGGGEASSPAGGPFPGAGGDVDAATYVLRTRDGPRESGAATFKKRRSKSADMWREDSLELSLSDLSQAHLTSTEEIVDTADERDFAHCDERLQSSPHGLELLDPADRANSLDELYGPKSPGCRQTGRRFAKWHKVAVTPGGESEEDKMLSPAEDDGSAYGAYTLPCRRSHCLSEGLTNHQAVMSASRRAQTIQVRSHKHKCYYE